MTLKKENVIGCVVGRKGSGKSHWTKHTVAPLWGRLLVIDAMAEYSPHVEAVHTDPMSLFRWLDDRDAGHHLAPFRCSFVPRVPADALQVLAGAWSLPDSLVIVEEVDQYSSPGYSPPELSQLILRGRHRRISTFTVTQRPAATPIQLRSQADIVAAFQLTVPQDVKALADVLGDRVESLYSLGVGEAIFHTTSDRPRRLGLLPR